MKKSIVLTTVICLLYCLQTATAQRVVRGPYLQLATPNSIIIRWRTDIATSSKVWYGPGYTSLSQTTVESGNRTEHEVELTGLTPNTVYHYAIGYGSNQLAGADNNHYFKSAPIHGAATPLSIWVLGDAGTADAEQLSVRDAFYNYNGSPHADLILALGDNAYADGTDLEFQQSWFENMYEASLVNSLLLPIVGNHELHSADSDDGTGPYFDIFNLPANGEGGGMPSGTESYYSFDYSNIHFVGLNSEETDFSPTGPMATWLTNDLANTEQEWIVAMIHRPIYYDRTALRRDIMPILEAGGVDLVLAGHHHIYQRSFLMNGHYGDEGTFDIATMTIDQGDGRPDGDGAYEKPPGITPNSGTVHLITGSAGKVSAMKGPYPFVASEAAELGSVHMEVNSIEMKVTFIDNAERVLDYFTILKGPLTDPVVNITGPADGTTYDTPRTIAITADASDPDGQVSRVEFFADGSRMGTDFSAPYTVNWTIPSEGIYEIYAVATDDQGNTTQSSGISISAGILSACASISLYSDDAEELISTGRVKLTSSDLEMCTEAESQVIGLRFQNMGIPPNADILSALIQFTVDETNNISPANLLIYGQASPNPGTFEGFTGDITRRFRTQASVSWSPNEWGPVGLAGADQRTPDLRTIVQQIVDQGNYTANSAIAFIMEGSGTRVARSYDKDIVSAPQLCILYRNSDCALQGASCDDGDACTVDDVYDADCNCAGLFIDSDGDGVCDSADLCPGGDDTVDTDGDGTPDACDNCSNDSDGDGICDGADQCPGGDDTLDADGDGTPDACDPCPDDPNDDSDGDGVCDGVDGCPGGNDNIDSDGDGTPDACDQCPSGPEPGSPCGNGNLIQPDCSCGEEVIELTVCSRISSSTDDAEEARVDGSVSVGSSDLELIDDKGAQTVGLRFLDLNIPKGAEIVNAHIQFTVDESRIIDPCNLTIYGQTGYNPGAFAGSLNNLSARSKTTTSVSWTPSNWSTVGAAGPAQKTPDLRSILQTVINQSSYVAGDAVVFLIEGRGKRVAQSFDKNPATAPQLCVLYRTTPSQSDFDCPFLGADVGDACDDGNPDTVNDVVRADCSCKGEPDSDGDGTPDYADQCNGGPEPGTSCDDQNSNTINDLIIEDCSCRGEVIASSDRLSVPVNSSNDDAEERLTTGTLLLASSDLELGEERAAQMVGIRFNNLAVPPGASITGAYIQFAVDEISTGPASFTIRGQAADQARAFSTLYDISSRSLTAASATWSPVDWTIVGNAGATQQTSDLSPLLQEVINRPGWAAGNSVAFVFSGFGTRTAESYDGDPTLAPVLHLEYNTQGCPAAGTACNDGNPCTTGDVYNADCGCAGVLQDDDSDGVCNADDLCPGGDDRFDTDNDGVPDDCDQCVGAEPGTACNDGNPNTVGETIQPDCSCGAGGSVTVSTCAKILNSSDDAEESLLDGSISTGSSDLELIDDNGPQVVGMRFLNLNIPKNAQIVSAHIQFTVDETRRIDPCNLVIFGQDSPDPGMFSNLFNDLSTRPKTSTSVNWTPGTWDLVGAAGSAQRTPNLSAIIQEIVEQDSYTSGSAIALMIEGSGKRTAQSFDKNPDNAPQLCVEYAVDGSVYDCPGLLANIGDACDDSNPNTVNDEVQADCRCAGLPDSDGDGTPDASDLCPGGPEPGTPCEDGNLQTSGETIQADCNCSGGITNVLNSCASIQFSTDDAELNPSTGRVQLQSSDLELVTEAAEQIVGLRFLGLDIPKNAQIISARLQFTVDKDSNINPCELMLHGESSPDPGTFIRSAGDLLNRPRTQAAVVWSPSDWTSIGFAGPDQQTPDLRLIIQEIVDQGTYHSTDAMVLIIEGTGKRMAASFDGNPAGAPRLCIEYGSPQSLAAEEAEAGAALHMEKRRLAVESDMKDLIPVRVYPNPSSGEVTLTFYSQEEERIDLQLLNVNGTVVRREQRKVQPGPNAVLIEDSGLPNGIYFIRFYLNGEVQTTKFVLMRD